MHITKNSSLFDPYTFVVHLIRKWLYHPYWSVHTPCPIFAPSAIFSQTPPKPSQDQSKACPINVQALSPLQFNTPPQA
uniref:Uncharacterized protein n=1 Tax=Brassica oleracea var. oleracea TaxID=109376 RepID=A0A0D3BV76_BRAOL